MLDQTASSSAMYFSVFFDGSIVTISMHRCTLFRLDVSATLGLFQYRCVVQHTMILKKEHTPILKKA